LRVRGRQRLPELQRRLGHVNQRQRQQPPGLIEIAAAGDGGREVEYLRVNAALDELVARFVLQHGPLFRDMTRARIGSAAVVHPQCNLTRER
jgi:hypothetical protein